MRILALFFLFPVYAFPQWNAIQVAHNTYNSVLRSMSQGVYDHYSDKSFFCLMQENSNPYVVSCDHSSGTHAWESPNLVYVQPAASRYNYPTVDMLPDRRLVLSYASPHDEALGFAITKNPADATVWNTKKVGTGDRNHVEYPRVKVDRQGNIYLFFIHMEQTDAAHKRWYYYVKSEDAGETWTEPILCLQRELDDPYGMCEMYVGYTVEEPYRQGEPERWWFAFTASSGFQFQGTHTGSDNSPHLIDTNATWGTGSNFSYRWLYNVTKGTNSGIDDASSTTVFPEQMMDWDNSDKYGIAYHNIYHSDIFVVYFCPDNGHWFDAAHNDLGVTVSRAEMETVTARPYISPVPPASKDVGYVQNLTVNDHGYPSTIHNGTLYSWDGNQWNTSTPDFPSNDLRYYWFTENKYYWAASRLSIYNSNDGNDWEEAGNMSLPDNHSYPTYSVYIEEGHAEAIINVHEYKPDLPGMAWAVSAGEEQTPEAIVLRTPKPKLSTNESTTVYAFVTDKVHGARSRVRVATNTISLSVVCGNATIDNSELITQNGLAEFTVTSTGTLPEVVILKATSTGLDNYYLNLYVNGGNLSTQSLSDVSTSHDWKVSPNPARNYVNLPEKVTLMKVFNIHGNVITESKIASGQTQIPLNLPAGTYIIQIFFKDKVKAEKIVVL